MTCSNHLLQGQSQVCLILPPLDGVEDSLAHPFLFPEKAIKRGKRRNTYFIYFAETLGSKPITET